jgi:hypothetical protein
MTNIKRGFISIPECKIGDAINFKFVCNFDLSDPIVNGAPVPRKLIMHVKNHAEGTTYLNFSSDDGNILFEEDPVELGWWWITLIQTGRETKNIPAPGKYVLDIVAYTNDDDDLTFIDGEIEFESRTTNRDI